MRTLSAKHAALDDVVADLVRRVKQLEPPPIEKRMAQVERVLASVEADTRRARVELDAVLTLVQIKRQRKSPLVPLDEPRKTRR